MTKEEFNQLKAGDIVFAEIIKENEWHPCFIIDKPKDLTTVFEAVLCPCDETSTGYILKSSVTRDYSELKSKEEIWKIVEEEYFTNNKKDKQ